MSLLLATPAAAQGGGGLYEPFPEPAGTGQVRSFIEGLPGQRGLASRLSDAELERGVFRGGDEADDTLEPASARAGVGADAGLLDGWPLLLAVLALAAGVSLAVARLRA
jgi:hypothetical protein